MRRPIYALVILTTLFFGMKLSAAGKDPLHPYESALWAAPATEIDTIVTHNLKAGGFALRTPASDPVFLRRVYIDLIGAMPTRQEAESFLADKDPDKRSKLIERLLSVKNMPITSA